MRVLCAVCEHHARTYENIIWDEHLDKDEKAFVDKDGWVCWECHNDMKKRVKNLKKSCG